MPGTQPPRDPVDDPWGSLPSGEGRWEGGGWGMPAGDGYGAGYGYGYPPPPPAPRRGRSLGGIALGLGIASLAILVLTALLVVLGFMLFFVAGFAALALAVHVVKVAFVLAVASIVLGLLAPGSFGKRLARTIPAWVTVLVFYVVSGPGPSAGEIESAPERPVSRGLLPEAEPDDDSSGEGPSRRFRVPAPCVDTAKDPFTCPVRRYGAP